MNYYERKIQFGFGGGLTPVVKYLLVANIAVYLVQQFAALKSNVTPSPIDLLAMNPDSVLHHFAIWQLFTYMFLHGSFFHIFFNMFSLFVFGCDVERILGSKRFLHFYFISGAGAALFYILFNWNSHGFLIGASGAIYGVLVAFAVLFPDRIITLLLFFIVPINLKARHLVAIFIGISVISGIQGQVFGISDGVAHLAHLGGALIGFLLLKGQPMLDQITHSIYQQKQQQKIISALRKQREIDRKRHEIDRILDRINQVGFDGITEKEKKVLKQASEFLSKE